MIDLSQPVMTPLVLRERDERGVVRITLNRPNAFNSLSEATLSALQAELDVVQAAEPSQAYYERLFAQCGRMMMTIQQLPVPVIARVQGIATAAGCQLVAMCDLAVAAREARFAVSGVNLGLFCSTPSVALSRNLSRKAAFEMLVTGAFISADEAQAKGLVNRVVEADQLDEEIDSLVNSIVAKPRVALAMGKSLFYRQLEVGIEEAYTDAGQTMACNMMDTAALEGVQAFIDKRAPDWRGAR
jgi:enoyl-CoA hydratase/carnithine racemase